MARSAQRRRSPPKRLVHPHGAPRDPAPGPGFRRPDRGRLRAIHPRAWEGSRRRRGGSGGVLETAEAGHGLVCPGPWDTSSSRSDGRGRRSRERRRSIAIRVPVTLATEQASRSRYARIRRRAPWLLPLGNRKRRFRPVGKAEPAGELESNHGRYPGDQYTVGIPCPGICARASNNLVSTGQYAGSDLLCTWPPFPCPGRPQHPVQTLTVLRTGSRNPSPAFHWPLQECPTPPP